MIQSIKDRTELFYLLLTSLVLSLYLQNSECQWKNVLKIRKWRKIKTIHGLDYRINLSDAQERVEQEEWAKEDFERELNFLKSREGVTQREIEQFKKSAIIKKSVEMVKMRAQHQAAIRHSPTRYSTVKSKVARCINVQKKTVKK